jgi:DNA end-binding protein Ku
MAELSAPPLPKADPQMLAIVEKIVEQQAGEFDPAEFVDRYEDALRDLIEEKKKGHVIKPMHVANDDTKVVDLMAALRNSLKAGGGGDRMPKAAASDRRREPSRRGPALKPRPRGGRHAA